MWIFNVVSSLLCLQTAVAIPFVTNVLTGVSYQGTSADGIEQFQNISFAKDTAGLNRFAPPVPYLPARGSTIQATASGAICPQPSLAPPNFLFDSSDSDLSEDCLNLRIARPANQSFDKPLPVMVWIYGGGWIRGQAYNRIYNPVGLVQESEASGHPVVYVAMNYRVGLFGFAASEALRDAKSENVGLRDQRLALQWVKDNIAAFGGDPDNITLFGQSAGSLSTGLQTVAFGGQQGAVFHKAITDSGIVVGTEESTGINSFSTRLPSNVTASVAQSLNCSGENRDAAAMVACLRDVPLAPLLSTALAQANIALPGGEDVFIPVIDGDFIPDRPSRLIQEGSFVKGISFIASWAADDASTFVPSFVNSEATVVAYFSTLFSNSTRDRVLSLYPVEEFEAQVIKNNSFTAQFYRASRIYRDFAFACPALNFTKEISLRSTNETYVFTINTTRYQPVWDAVNQPQWQIAHASDIPYYFNVDVVGGDNSKAALDLSAEVSRSYSAFATFGSPSTPVFDWPAAWSGHSGENATVFVIGGPYGSGPATLEPRHSTAAHRGLPAYGRSVKVSNSTSAGTSSANDLRSEALAREKLVERCAFFDAIVDGPSS